MFFTWEGWLISAVFILAGYIFLVLGFLLLSPVLESLRIHAEKRLEHRIIEKYQGRWLGLWSRHDEAINGLRTTLDLSVSFVSHMTRRERILLSDYLSLASRPYFWVAAPLFNHFIRPFLDRVVRSLVVKTAQGNNRPATEVVAVSPLPAAELESANHPAIPDWLDECIVDEANRHVRDVAPMLREMLSEPTLANGLERLGGILAGEELVHTSYFDHEAILKLLVAHIAWAARDKAALQQFQETHPRLWNWFRHFKACVEIEVETADAPSTRPFPKQLIRPRRRANAA